MTRYIKQRDEYSCGPVAIINAMKWLGFPATARDLPQLKKECRTEVGGGTVPKDLDRAIRRHIPRVRQIDSPTLRELDEYLKRGRAAILGYSYRREDGVEEGHYTFIVHDLKYIPKDKWELNHFYLMANDVDTATGDIKYSISAKTRKQMNKAFYYKNEDGDQATVWFI